MKKSARILAVLAAAATLGLGLSSCDYWNEDWYKNGGDTSTASSGGSSSGSGSDTTTPTTPATTPTTPATTPTTPAATATTTAAVTASGTDTIYLTPQIACLGATVGETVSVAVTDASGNSVTTGVTYQWQKIGDWDSGKHDDNGWEVFYTAEDDVSGNFPATWFDIPGATGASYTIVDSDINTGSDTSGNSYLLVYRCKVTNGSTVVDPDPTQYIKVSYTLP